MYVLRPREIKYRVPVVDKVTSRKSKEFQPPVFGEVVKHGPLSRGTSSMRQFFCQSISDLISIRDQPFNGCLEPSSYCTGSSMMKRWLYHEVCFYILRTETQGRGSRYRAPVVDKGSDRQSKEFASRIFEDVVTHGPLSRGMWSGR